MHVTSDEQALEQIGRAVIIDPATPDSAFYQNHHDRRGRLIRLRNAGTPGVIQQANVDGIFVNWRENGRDCGHWLEWRDVRPER